jgi:DNA-binding GntR family transcriptional regulator
LRGIPTELNLPKEPQKLADLVYQALEHAILNNQLVPGQKLVEDEISLQLGVSVTPVREALVRLEREGLVTRAFYRTPTVRVFTRKEAVELCYLRGALEQLAIELACERITSAGIERLIQTQKDADACLAADDFSGYVRTNEAFHKILIELSENELLMETLRGIWNQIQMINVTSAQIPGTPRQSVAEHLKIIEALKASDAAGAKRLMRMHIRRLRKRLEKALKD